MSKVRAIETVLVLDDGKYVTRQLLVVRAINLHVDCGCWRQRHDIPHDYEVIITFDRASGDNAYIRAAGDHAFRSVDMSGPIVVTIDRIYTPTLETTNGTEEQT